MSDKDHKDDMNIDDTKKHDTKDHEDNYESVCYLCRRPKSKVGKMIHIPNNIDICADCMQKTFDAINQGDNPYMQMMGLTPNMLFMPNLPNDVSKPQKLKKKKPEEEKEPEIIFDRRKIPAPQIGRAHV